MHLKEHWVEPTADSTKNEVVWFRPQLLEHVQGRVRVEIYSLCYRRGNVEKIEAMLPPAQSLH